MTKCPRGHNGLDMWPFEEKDGILWARGVDIGPKPTIIKRKDDLVVVYVKGHRVWSGYGRQPRYIGATFHVLRKMCDEHYQFVIDFPAAARTEELTK